MLVQYIDSRLREKHEVICGAYVRLPPRPSKAHRICILFPFDDQRLRLIWVDPNDRDAIRDIVAPHPATLDCYAGPAINLNDDEDLWRETRLEHIACFRFEIQLARNQSLGLATSGRPLESMRGPLLVAVCECSLDDILCKCLIDDAPPSDIAPGDFLAVLCTFMWTEAAYFHGQMHSA